MKGEAEQRGSSLRGEEARAQTVNFAVRIEKLGITLLSTADSVRPRGRRSFPGAGEGGSFSAPTTASALRLRADISAFSGVNASIDVVSDSFGADLRKRAPFPAGPINFDVRIERRPLVISVGAVEVFGFSSALLFSRGRCGKRARGNRSRFRSDYVVEQGTAGRPRRTSGGGGGGGGQRCVLIAVVDDGATVERRNLDFFQLQNGGRRDGTNLVYARKGKRRKSVICG